MKPDIAAIRARCEAGKPVAFINTGISQANLDLFTHAKTDGLALLDYIAELEAENERLSKWSSDCEETNERLLCENERLRAVIQKVYDRTKPGGIEGGYPYGATTSIGSDVYYLVKDHMPLPQPPESEGQG